MIFPQKLLHSDLVQEDVFSYSPIFLFPVQTGDTPTIYAQLPASEFDDENESSKEKLEDSEDDGGLSIFGIPIPKIPFPILSFGNYNAHLILVQYSVKKTRILKSVLVLILIWF